MGEGKLTMAKKPKEKQYHFVFAFTGECCQRAHLWAQSRFGISRDQALRAVLKEVRANGRDVSEVLSVSMPIGPVCEVEDE